ncbi:hypothetical protein BBK36DRAFT_1202220 [Trichoderma citrinoviride]|uniref:Uncharacterized protein n=1 Tax=Trichoderma citrinoviride TaxID=58853 RepID=A0A2T4B8F8_9HYPO|nr:hypothetical protein BBK36DRAFT_1202220 [Trichoderma citrinoviride]PTB65613.1 hypothetical protein BBK36DRAFT_1202220 [Trichoderma citrinoviride]
MNILRFGLGPNGSRSADIGSCALAYIRLNTTSQTRGCFLGSARPAHVLPRILPILRQVDKAKYSSLLGGPLRTSSPASGESEYADVVVVEEASFIMRMEWKRRNKHKSGYRPLELVKSVWQLLTEEHLKRVRAHGRQVSGAFVFGCLVNWQNACLTTPCLPNPPMTHRVTQYMV